MRYPAKVLLVCGAMSTFTRIDLDILQDAFDTRHVLVQRNSLKNFIKTIAQSITGVFWADVIIAWFGSYFAFLPFVTAKLLRRKCIIIASGYDLANQPEINYGNMRPGVRRWVGLANYAMADKVLAVSEFTRGEAIQNAHVNPRKIEVIVHGIPLVKESSGAKDSTTKRKQVLTVATISRNTLNLKGLYTFVCAASLLPEVPFLLVGPQRDTALDELRSFAPSNVQMIGPLYGDELQRVMNESKVYVQLSAYESFGMALAESMAAECIPVATNRAALPEVIGDIGYKVPYADVVATALAIHKALHADDAEGIRARERVYREFPLTLRKQALVMAVCNVYQA